MKLLIAIATYKRIEKLQRLLNSLFEQTYKDFEIVIVCDNKDYETENYLKGPNMYKLYDVIVQEEQKFVIGAWNRAVKECFFDSLLEWSEEKPRRDHFDGFVGLVDDVELYKDTLEVAVREFKSVYNKSTDGVLGFHQECPGHEEIYSFKWYGQTLIGRDFIERYQTVDYQICCPMYRWSHQDEEMWQYASSLGKFHQCRKAILKHYHPSFIKEEIDETHNLVRYGINSPREHDLKLFNERQKLGLIWPLA